MTCSGSPVEPLAAKLGITGLTSADFDYLTRGWHSLEPWPDSVGGLTRLKKNFIISPLSNGNVALLVNMAEACRIAVGSGPKRRSLQTLQAGSGDLSRGGKDPELEA